MWVFGYLGKNVGGLVDDIILYRAMLTYMKGLEKYHYCHQVRKESKKERKKERRKEKKKGKRSIPSSLFFFLFFFSSFSSSFFFIFPFLLFRVYDWLYILPFLFNF